MSQRASTSGISGLPVEIVEFVVEQMLQSDCEGSLAALAATCRGLHGVVMPRLYSKENMENHPALIFWAAQLGRVDTAKRLIDAGVSLDRGMIRNEAKAYLDTRTATFTPRQLYHELRIINPQINPHDTLARVGPRGFVGEPFKPRPKNTSFDMNPFAHWRSWWFPLHLAVAGGHTDLVDLFLASGAILDVPSGNFCTCKYPVLANLGAHHPVTQFRRPWTPLHVAICGRHVEIAKTLLQRGASLSFAENLKSIPHPFMALHNAACVGSTELVEFILDNKYQTDVSIVDSTELSPLWLAYRQGHWDVIDTLISRGADIDDDLAAGYTPLIDACLFGEFESALKLIVRGADVNVACTAYPMAFSRYRYQATNNLLVPLRGHRPLDLCCMKQQSSTRSLRYRREPPNPRGYGVHDALMPPAAPEPIPLVDESLRTSVVEALLDAGANMDACGHSPGLVPPLVSAAAEHLVDVVRLLLDRGADVDARDKDGNSALMATLNYSLHWCPSHAKVGPMSARPFGLQRPPRAPPVPLHPGPPPGPPPPGNPGIPPGLVHPAPVVVLPPPLHPPPHVNYGPPPGFVPPPGMQPIQPPPPLIQIGHNPPQFVPAPPQPIIIVQHLPRPKPPSCRQQGDFTACVKLLIERGADPKATNNSGGTPLTLVYSPEAAPGTRYASGRPRGHLTFKERAVVVSMLLDLGADPNTKITIVRPDESNSDVESDDPNVYSASDSEDSLNTAQGSDYASSGVSFRPARRRKYRSLYNYGPLSVLQCAFWDGDLDLCRSLLDRGAELTTPIVAWMLHVAWGYCRWRMRDAAERVLQVLGDLEVSRQTELGSHPACLYVLISQGVRHMAAELLELGIERAKFDSVPGTEYAWLFGDKANPGTKTWGDLCLAQAVRTGWLAGIEPLLQLGLGVDSPGLEGAGKSPLLLAITRRDAAMVDHLVHHGAAVKLSDDSDPVKFTRGERRYPLVVAIRIEEPDIISALLREQKTPLPPQFAYAYIRETYTTRRAKALNCLLGYPHILDPHATALGTGNSHLVEMMAHVSTICTNQSSRSPNRSSGTDSNDDAAQPRYWSYSIKSKLDKVRMWIECLVLLARAGIDPKLKNDKGEDAIGLFEGLVNYKGPDRFRVHVRSALRSRLNEVMGLTVWDEEIKAEDAFEALGRCAVNLEESDGSVTSDGTVDD